MKDNNFTTNPNTVISPENVQSLGDVRFFVVCGINNFIAVVPMIHFGNLL